MQFRSETNGWVVHGASKTNSRSRRFDCCERKRTVKRCEQRGKKNRNNNEVAPSTRAVRPEIRQRRSTTTTTTMMMTTTTTTTTSRQTAIAIASTKTPIHSQKVARSSKKANLSSSYAFRRLLFRAAALVTRLQIEERLKRIQSAGFSDGTM